MAKHTCPTCGDLLETEVCWVVDFPGDRETPEEGHNECCFCGKEINDESN